MLYYHRKQDGLIFEGTQSHKALLENLLSLAPEMFRSDCPVFMPLEYSDIVELRLDSHIIFYEQHGDGGYSLVDKFAVNGGQGGNSIDIKCCPKTFPRSFIPIV